MTTRNHTKLLKNFKAFWPDLLQRRFKEFFSNVDDVIFRLANQAKTSKETNLLFEVRSYFNNHCNQLTASTLEKLHAISSNEKALSSLRDKEKSLSEESEIALIDLRSYEHWLAMQVIINNAQKSYLRPIQCLERRYSELVGEKVDGNDLPMAIAKICSSFEEAIKEDIEDNEYLPIIFNLFDNIFVLNMGEFYDGLNSYLEQNGILPDLEATIISTLFKEAFQRRNNATETKPKEDVQTENVEAAPTATTNTLPRQSESYSALKDLLSIEKPTAQNSTSESSLPVIDESQLTAILDDLSNNEKFLNALLSGEKLGNVLAGELQAADSGNTFSVDMTSKIDLLEQLFTLLQNDPKIPTSLKTSLVRLQIPITQLALNSDSFFTDPEDAARNFLNDLAIICSNTDNSNQLTTKKIKSTINTLCSLEAISSADVINAKTELQNFVEQQKKLYKRNIARLAQSYEAKQKITAAKKATDTAIQQVLNQKMIPAVIVELMETVWFDLLFKHNLKIDQDKTPWNNAILTLKYLVENISNPKERSEKKTIQLVESVRTQLNEALPQDIRVDATTKLIAETLSNKETPKMVETPKSFLPETIQSTTVTSPKGGNANLGTWVALAKQLRGGQHLSYLNNPDAPRLELAWKADNNEQFVFANEMGQVILDLTLEETAVELQRGLCVSSEKADLPLVDQGLFASVKRVYEHLNENQGRDELTNLISRKAFKKAVQTCLMETKAGNKVFSLLYIDLDKLTIVNETYSHTIGDRVITDISRLISAIAPEKSTFARLLGNEFALLVPNCDDSASNILAEKIRLNIAQHLFEWHEHEMKITASIGITFIGKDSINDVDAIIKEAQLACTDAKQNGRDRISHYHQVGESVERQQKFLRWVDHLDSIEDEQQLVLRGQLIAPAKASDKPPHYEILLGLKSSSGEILGPAEFISVIESHQLMYKVDKWVIDKAFSWLSSLNKQNGKQPHLSINLSGNSINSEGFIDFLKSMFAQHSIAAELICFEVTETAAIHDIAKAAQFLRELKLLGCQISLDDFGSGHSSYEYLKHLPIDFLKIDGSFVKEICWNKEDAAMVKSMNEIAHLLSMQTIAEFAENEKIIKELIAIGVDFIQGYGIARPILLSEITNANHIAA